MSERRNAIEFLTTFKGWKRPALLAFASLTIAAAALVWLSGDRLDPPGAGAEREPQHRLASALTTEPTAARTPPTAAHDDLAEKLPRPAPRSVSEQQKKNAAEVLRGFPLDQRPLAEPVAVLALAGDPEAAQYAEQLAQVLKEGGWATTIGTTRVMYIGVMCLVDNAQQFPVHARALTYAFERAGIACTAANNDAAPSNRIEIVVGQKPGN